MKQKVTINDVAASCGVSKSSVSRYLNKGYVSKESALKIAKAIEELGFETNFFASRLKAKCSRLIGVLAADLSDEVAAKILNGMQAKWNANGYQGMILLSNHELDKEKAAIQSFAQQGVDGIIVLQCNHVEELADTVQKYGVPLLYANQSCTYAPYLAIDEKKAGMLMGKYLAKQDIRRITYLQSNQNSGEKRKDGLCAAYDEMGFACDFDTVTFDGTLASASKECTSLLAKQRECILCERDDVALAVVKCCHEYHVHVPQNVCIAAFGGLTLSVLCAPSITTLACDYAAFGANLVEEICAIVETREPKWCDVDMKMIERESVRLLG